MSKRVSLLALALHSRLAGARLAQDRRRQAEAAKASLRSRCGPRPDGRLSARPPSRVSSLRTTLARSETRAARAGAARSADGLWETEARGRSTLPPRVVRRGAADAEAERRVADDGASSARAAASLQLPPSLPPSPRLAASATARSARVPDEARRGRKRELESAALNPTSARPTSMRPPRWRRRLGRQAPAPRHPRLRTATWSAR